jgi:hypothetical protein
MSPRPASYIVGLALDIDVTVAVEHRDNFDLAHEVAVELVQLSGGNLVFLMSRTADGVYLEAGQVIGSHSKTQNIAAKVRAWILGAPIARNLFSISPGEQGIEDGLLRRLRRKRTIIRSRDPIEFLLANRSKKFDYRLVLHWLQRLACPAEDIVHSRLPARAGSLVTG